jgi:hypothetical protein
MKTVSVTNTTSGQTLSDSAELAVGFFERLIGLMGRAVLDRGEGMVISPCASIHTMFMRFPIDVVFYGDGGKVVAALPSLKPYRATRYYVGAKGVVELPAGTLETMKVSPGDIIEIGEAVSL